MQLGGNPSVIRNCKVANFTSMGVFMAAPGQGIYDCEVTGGTSSASRAVLINDVGQCIVRCNIHDNVCIGVLIAGTSAGCVRNCLITNNTGAGNAGIKIDNNYYGAVHNNVIWGSGGNGISIGTRWWGAIEIRGNILGNNGGYNIEEIDGAGSPAGPWWDGNAYFTSTSGNRNNLDDTTTNPINGVSPYTNVLDVALSGDPFTNSAGGDFTLNNTTGAGAACRAVGFPGAMPGVSQVGYMDFGIFQHQDSGGGGGGGASSIGLGSPGIRAAN
jgi:hypothetical protein